VQSGDDVRRQFETERGARVFIHGSIIYEQK
jgi:hypothetical protein